MDLKAWLTVAITAIALLILISGRWRSYVVLGGAWALLLITGVMTPERAVGGFSSLAMLTVGLLFVVAAALRASGALEFLSKPLLREGKVGVLGLLRLCIPVAALSAVLNNTPVVAMLIPEVRAWARRAGTPASKVLIPLSYAAILGGLGTMIGTSTNLVVNDLVIAGGEEGFGFLEIGLLGLPVAAVGIAVIVIGQRWLLPERPDLDRAFADPRTFTAELIVDPEGPMVGRRLADVRIGSLSGLAPVEINRGGHVIPAPRGDHVLEAGDRLVVAGSAVGVLALHQAPGLLLAADHAFAADLEDGAHQLIEVVISERCPLVGEAVGDGSFRRLYNAAVIAVARRGERVTASGLKGWRLHAGDTLLVAAGGDFLDRHRYHPDFHVVTGHGRARPASPGRSWAAIAILAGMVGLAASQVMGMFQAVVLAVVVLLFGRFIDRREARGAVDVPVLLTIAFALGIGAALADTGAAAAIAGELLAVAGDHPLSSLVAVYLATAVLTELVTNTAAAALMVPIALATADRLGAQHQAFVAIVMVAASASFVTPLGYQTNLMVAGPGGYRFADFARAGFPVSVAVGVTAVALAPLIWPW